MLKRPGILFCKELAILIQDAFQLIEDFTSDVRCGKLINNFIYLVLF